MAVAVTMHPTSTSVLDHWKPKYAARQLQEQQQRPQQPLPRSRSLREPFDAAELTRKLECYRQELKLERARRELAATKAERTEGTISPEIPEAPVRRQAFSGTAGKPSSSGVQRSKTVHASNNLTVDHQPERKRSLLHRKHKEEEKENGMDKHTEPAGPYIPRTAAKQFKSTTTPLKDKKERKETQHESQLRIKDTSSRHKLDWSPPMMSPASPPTATYDAVDEETMQQRIKAMHAFQAASKPRPRPLSTALENFRVWNHEPQANPYAPSALSPRNVPEEIEPETSAIRPQLKQGDRHDWSQASQCGDSARHSLHLFPMGRKKDTKSEDAEMAGLKKRKPRQKSHGDQPDNLVGEAVRLIKEEKKKSSILGMFRRH